jgi:predicted phosphate transport protein (TIGR00153 family)
MRWLMPRDDSFFVLFERSAATMVEAAEALQEFWSGGPIDEESFKVLDDIEHQGDAITHEVTARIGRTFITPLDRDDIHRLIHMLDNVIDATESAGEIAVLCKVTEIQPYAQEMTQVLVGITKEVAALVPSLRHANGYQQHIVRAHQLENEGDRLWARAFASLFEGGLDPLDVIRWKEIYQVIEDAIDATEDVAQILEEIIYKQA